MNQRRRGRPRKFEWIEFEDLNHNHSFEAQYLKFASVNNPSLARLASYGCPLCESINFRLRHDKRFENIRFYCENCKYETSFRARKPTRNELRTILIYDERGILVGEKIADDFHERTSRETADSAVAWAEQNVDLGGEWFDGTSGTHMQNRYLAREEALNLIEKRRMRMQMKAMLDEIEREQEDDRLAAIEAEIACDEAEA
jgi:hypothetical protein